MNKEEWNLYVDTGKVPRHFIKSMVDCIKTGKLPTPQQIAVYSSHGTLIEALLSENIMFLVLSILIYMYTKAKG